MNTINSLYIPLSHRTAISVSGEDASSFLQGIITNDIHKATDKNALYALMLTPQGKFLYDFFIVKHMNQFLIDVSASHKEAILKKFNMYKLRSKVVVEDVSDHYETVALIGENVVKEINQTEDGHIRNFCKGVAYIDPRSAELGARAIIEKENKYQSFEAKDFHLGTPENYETHRISLAIPDGDYDLISGESFPLDFGCDQRNTIDFKKGCYVGQEVTARVHYKSSPKKAVYKVYSNSETLPKNDSNIMIGNVKAGELRSCQANIGLALLRKNDVKGHCEGVVDNIKITISQS